MIIYSWGWSALFLATFPTYPFSRRLWFGVTLILPDGVGEETQSAAHCAATPRLILFVNPTTRRQKRQKNANLKGGSRESWNIRLSNGRKLPAAEVWTS